MIRRWLAVLLLLALPLQGQMIVRRGAASCLAGISGLTVWVDETGHQTDVDGVHTWTDLSGEGNDIAQSTGSLKPDVTAAGKAGLDIVTFDGIDDHLLTGAFTTLTQPTTIFAVWQSHSSNTGTIWDGITSGDRQMAYTNAGAGNKLFSGGSEFVVASPADNAWHIYIAEYNGSSSKVLDNGSETTGTLGTGSLTGFAIGARGHDGAFPFNRSIGEIGIIDGAISDGVRATLSACLNTKWTVY